MYVCTYVRTYVRMYVCMSVELTEADKEVMDDVHLQHLRSKFSL